jgi:sec-independent protein translocase protein TatB
MFGMGFTEILIIAVIAILFLGPDKLPSTMVEIAKFFRNAKNTIGSVKESLEEEMQVKDIKEEALAYKRELLETGTKIKSATDVKKMAAELTSLEDEGDFLDDGFFDEPKKDEKASDETGTQEVTLKKKTKKKENKEDTKDV